MTTNAEQIALWNGPGGERRAWQPHLIDAQVRLHNERLRAAAAITATEHVLDVGCGTGQANAEILAGMDAAEAARAMGRLRDALAAHQTGEGVALVARTWIITARRG